VEHSAIDGEDAAWGQGRCDTGAVVIGGQPAQAPLWHRAVLGDLDFMHAALLLLPPVPADVPGQAHQGISRASARPPVAGAQANGWLLPSLCVCDCSFSLLLVLAIENLFDLISCTDD
jgi:hypothetical protein